MEPTHMGYDELAQRYHITADATEVHANPNIDEADFDEGASHWEVTLYHADDPERRYMTLYYTMGSAHVGPPSAGDVLVTLAMDARMQEAGELASFDDYCAAFGYDNDSRRAERAYWRVRDVVGRQTADLHYMLQDDYAKLLDDEAAN